MNFFQATLGRKEGGWFISQKPLKQVFSATLLRWFLWVFRVIPTVFIWVFMWILIISYTKSAYFTFGTRILHWKLKHFLDHKREKIWFSKILSNFQCNMRVPNVKYADFWLLIIKIHIKIHMKTVGMTLKTLKYLF